MLYNVVFFYLAMLLHSASAYFFIKYLVKKKEESFSYHKQWFLVAVMAGAFCLMTRYKESGHLPFVNMFEITFFYAWMISVLYLVFVRREISRFIQSVTLTIIYAILIWDIFLDKELHPLNPLLDSYWLSIHVPAAILGYSAFALSFAISLYYFYAERKTKSLNHITLLNSQLTVGGVLLLGICIITGAIWAKSAWGSYWSWDPKETWALITFLIYGCAVLVKEVFKLNPRWQATLSISGFMAMLFTFFGVAFFMTSHHTYQ